MFFFRKLEHFEAAISVELRECIEQAAVAHYGGTGEAEAAANAGSELARHIGEDEAFGDGGGGGGGGGIYHLDFDDLAWSAGMIFEERTGSAKTSEECDVAIQELEALLKAIRQKKEQLGAEEQLEAALGSKG